MYGHLTDEKLENLRRLAKDEHVNRNGYTQRNKKDVYTPVEHKGKRIRLPTRSNA